MAMYKTSVFSSAMRSRGVLFYRQLNDMPSYMWIWLLVRVICTNHIRCDWCNSAWRFFKYVSLIDCFIFLCLASLLRSVVSVNSAPSSGCRVGFPPIAATARGCRSGVALPPASPLSRVCPRRRGGSPSGDLSAPPALSLRGWGLEVLIRPPSVGRMREGDFPPLVTPVAATRGGTPTQTYLRTGGP